MTGPQGAPMRHRAQELLLQGFRALREDPLAKEWDPSTLSALEECIRRLSPLEGMGPMPAQARLSALAHALRVLTEDLLPHVDLQKVDIRPFPSTLSRLEEGLRAPRQ